MRRDLQNNDIRTNIVVELNITGVHSAQLVMDSLTKLVNDAKEKSLKVHLVGVSLKKPTASFELFLDRAVKVVKLTEDELICKAEEDGDTNISSTSNESVGEDDD